MGIAIIVGGAQQVHEDLAAAISFCVEAGHKPVLFVVNDMIPIVEGPIVAVSLHPAKLQDVNTRTLQHRGWLSQRAERGYPVPEQVWSLQRSAGVTHVLEDWGGSGGLYAVRIALHRCGHDRIILAGVPMDVNAKHFVRKQPWNACIQFQRAWHLRQKDIAPFVRSMSGWTAQQFGFPTIKFLTPKIAVEQNTG